MNTSRKAMEWFICFSNVNLMLGCLLFKKIKKLMNLVPRQKQLECHPNIRFTMEKQMNHSIVFLYILISGIKNQNLTLQTYHKLTFLGTNTN